MATPLAAGSLIAVMLTAIRKEHFQNGLWASDGGFEYNAVLIASLAMLADAGPGPLSLDAALGIEKRGIRWGIAALAAGALASAAAIKIGERTPSQTAASDEQAELQ